MASTSSSRIAGDQYDSFFGQRSQDTGTIDPTGIKNSSQIPPANALHVGTSSQGLVDIYCGSVTGDVDAQSAAKELLLAGTDTGGLSNADYIYNQLSALYGGIRLPTFHSPSGRDNVVSIVFVSGSQHGGYGAFHINGTQIDFDRIVVDSLTTTGNYSTGSSLPAGLRPATVPLPNSFPIFNGIGGLFGVFNKDNPTLRTTKPATIRDTILIGTQCQRSLRTALGTGTTPSMKEPIITGTRNNPDQEMQLVQTNQDIRGLLSALAKLNPSRQYLSTALFTAELAECFEKVTGKGDPGKTDGESVSRLLAYKICPEIALIPGFNSHVIQQWWKNGAPDLVNVNSENDQSTDGNAAGVLFLEFLTDYLGIPVEELLKRMPSSRGAPLGQTYQNLLSTHPELTSMAGSNGRAAFQKMVSLLKQKANSDGTLNLPADGNPFKTLPGSKQGGLFNTPGQDSIAFSQNTEKAVGLASQFDQQFAQFKNTLQQIRSDIIAQPTITTAPELSFGYRPPLSSALSLKLERQVQPYRAPQFDQSLQQEFWPHVYNELVGTGPHTDRLHVITGTNQTPLAVQITGTIGKTKLEPDGDLHIFFQPDDPNFPTNQGVGESPLELEIIYAGPVTQPDAKQAERGFTNPFNISSLTPGTRILVAGPVIFDRAHGQPTPDGNAVSSGLEIHPVTGVTVLSSKQAPQTNTGQVSSDVSSALGQIDGLNQTLQNLNNLLREMQKEEPFCTRVQRTAPTVGVR